MTAMRGTLGSAIRNEKLLAPTSVEPRRARTSARSGMALLVREWSPCKAAQMHDRDEAVTRLGEEH